MKSLTSCRKEIQSTEVKRIQSKKLMRQHPIPSIKEGEVLKTRPSTSQSIQASEMSSANDAQDGTIATTATGAPKHYKFTWWKPNLPRDRSLSLPTAHGRLKLVRNCIR